MYQLDGDISYARAALFAEILNSLSPTQAEQLAKLAATDVSDWPSRGQESTVEVWRQELDPATHVTLMTLAGQLYSWYDGNVEADTYFCPERHGTYFGSFYMKDIPAYHPKFFRVTEPKSPRFSSEDLYRLVPFNQKQIYNFDEVLARLVDGSEHMEFRPGYGPEV